MCIHTSIADQDLDPLCLLLNLLSRGTNILNITEITLDKDDSIVILTELDSLSDSPFIIGSVELGSASSDDEDLFDSVEKQLCCDLYIEQGAESDH